MLCEEYSVVIVWILFIRKWKIYVIDQVIFFYFYFKKLNIME